MRIERVSYRDGDLPLTGLLARPDGAPRAAVAAVFDGRIELHALGDQWVALPCAAPPHGASHKDAQVGGR